MFFSHFGFESGISVLIAPVPSHCILVTFKSDHLNPFYVYGINFLNANSLYLGQSR